MEGVHLGYDETTKREELKSKNKTATFPALETQHGFISETHAITQYLVEAYNPALLGANPFEKAEVRQWIEFFNNEIYRNNKALIYPLFGWAEYNKNDADAANKEIKAHLGLVNKHLEGKHYLVGSSLTLADLTLFNAVRSYFQFVFVENMRKSLFPHLTTWFVNQLKNQHINEVYGRTILCKVPLKAHVVEKKEEPKKEDKPAAKKEKTADAEDEDKPKKKAANPLELLPPSSFVLDDFKREFLNCPDKAASLANFWTKWDPTGYSFWFMQYQKLPSEGKVLFMTNNLCGIFLQNLDTFRKYTFSVHGVYGVEGDYEIRGVWMWRGTDIPAEIREHDSFPYLTIKKLDHTNENDKKLVESYWLNLNSGTVVDGLPVAETVYFK